MASTSASTPAASTAAFAPSSSSWTLMSVLRVIALAATAAAILLTGWRFASARGVADAPAHAVSLVEALHGVGGAAVHDVASIAEALRRAFEALPKDVTGLVSSRGAHYLIRRYFSEKHGWNIHGLESLISKMASRVPGEDVFLGKSEVLELPRLHALDLLQDRAPEFAAEMERHQESGFSLKDIAAVVVTLRRLILDEARIVLENSYDVRGHPLRVPLSEEGARDVLFSYMLVVDNAISAQKFKNRLAHEEAQRRIQRYPVILELVTFLSDIFHSYTHQHRFELNPFVAPRYSFDAMLDIAALLLKDYGHWLTGNCHSMKDVLTGLARPHGSGRVPLDTFHGYPTDPSSLFGFEESAGRLRDLGALDETAAAGPSVLVANYVLAPTNCAYTSGYYAVCCIDECEGLRRELEDSVRSPTATPDLLMGLASNTSSSTVDAPRKLEPQLVEKLRSIADRHGGVVPLQSRLFWQWLHFAFPNECPFPGATAQRPRLPASPTSLASSASKYALWSDEEIMPLQEPPRSPVVGALVCGALQLAAVAALMVTASQIWGSARRARAGMIGRAKGHAVQTTPT